MRTQLRKLLGLSASALLLAGSNAWAAQTLEYTIRWNSSDARYHVYMRPTTTPSPKDMSTTGQVTIVVPHISGANTFTPVALKSTIANTMWADNSRADAPKENPNSDYISFSLSYAKADAFAWKATEEKEVFSFANSSTCPGPIVIMNNDTDPFNKIPNSLNTNPGNHFTNLGWGDSGDNNFLRTYGYAADCRDTDKDGIGDSEEIALGIDPNNADTDGDGLSDNAEINTYKTDPLKPDTDGDG